MNILGKIPFIRPYSTKTHTFIWANCKKDWEKEYLATWNHPHRGLITWMLKSINFQSLWEVGCGGGANLARIVKELPGKQLGGCDVNPEAIEVANKAFKGGIFHVETGDNMLMSDKSVDIILTDMTLIYVGPFKIKDYLNEFKRISRNYVVMIEFDSDNWFVRQWERINGHHSHNFRKLLEGLGYYDIMIQKIPPEFYPNEEVGLRRLITARVI